MGQPIHQVQVAFEEPGVVERQVGRSDSHAPFVGAGLWLAVVVDDFKQGRHGAWVAAEEYDFVTFLHVEVYIVEKYCPVFRGGFQPFHFQNLVARFTFHLEDDARIFAGGRTDFLHVQFFQHFLAAGGLFAFGHVGREAPDEFLQFLFLFLGFGFLVLCLFQSQLAGLVPEAVVPGKQGDFPEVDVHRVGAYGVKEVTVVAHDQHRVFKFGKIILKPLHGVQVQVVGRFVQQQVVGFTEEGFGQHDAHLLLTAKFAHQFLVEVFLDAQSAQQGRCVAFGVISAHFREFLFQLGHLDAVFVREVGLGIQGIALLHDVPQHGVSHQHGVQHRVAVIFEVVLAQHGQALARSHFHASFCRFQFAGDSFQKSGFSRAVRADDAIDIAVGELHVHVFVQDPFAELDGKV